MKINNKITILSIIFLSSSLLTACGGKKEEQNKKDLVILYTNDVHCAIDENIGYSGLVSYKNKVLSENNEVMLVDCGDHIQGAPVGTLSKGEYIIDIMNEVGYDVAVPGNHEFDYTADYFVELSKKANYPYVSSNFCYAKDDSNIFDSYKIIERGGYKVGFIGVCTPLTVSSSAPKNFEDEDGHMKYTFLENNGGEKFYKKVQNTINEVKNKGVDYVVALAHVGEESEFTSEILASKVSGFDVILDGHSHSIVESKKVLDKAGKEVIISQTGTQLTNIGELDITKDGVISTKLISKEMYTEKDEQLTSFINNIKDKYEKDISKKLGHTDFDLTIYDPNTGDRLIRKQDTNMGDLVADAFRDYGQTDIALQNGGGVRSDIKAGDITYKDVMTVCPFGNNFCIIKATGEMIRNSLESGMRFYPNENGQVAIPSGITYVVDTTINSGVVTDENGAFVKMNGQPRVKDIKINGEPLEDTKTYTISGTSYFLIECGEAVVFKDAEIIRQEATTDYEILARYIAETLNGVIPETYSNPYGQGRISFKS